MNETEIQKEILGWLAMAGYSAWRMPLGGVRHSGAYKQNPLKGFPDIFGICKNRPGVMFAIEVKAPGGKVSEHQQEWLNRLRDLGCITIVADNVERVADVLSKIDLTREQYIRRRDGGGLSGDGKHLLR